MRIVLNFQNLDSIYSFGAETIETNESILK